MSDPEKEPEEGHIKPFLTTLREIENGRVSDELGEYLHKLVTAVKETGKKGSMGFQLTVEPMKGASEVMQVSVNTQLKSPQHDRRKTIFYADKTGNLSRNDPNQLQFTGLERVGDPSESSTTKASNL